MFSVVEVCYLDEEGGTVYGEEIALTSSLEDAEDEARMHFLAEPWTYGIEILELVSTGFDKVWIPAKQI